jgi:perosamine synthetase
MKRIAMAVPDLSGNELAYVADAIKSTWISSNGGYLQRFEQEYADLCQSNHCLAVSNGTAALHLALMTLGVGEGDEVIVPSLTYIATANAVRYVGATPVFVDVHMDSWCMQEESVSRSITDRTRAIIAVHLYGQPAAMGPLMAIAAEAGIYVIEDAAEAPFAQYKGKPTGGLGHMATFSFYGNKILTSGEGGALTVHDSELAAKAALIRGQGMDPSRRYHFPVLGHNFRLTNVSAAILCAQLERAKELLERRNDVYAEYRARLEKIPGLVMQSKIAETCASPWLFSILIDDTRGCVDRDTLMEHLARRGVETRPFFPPVHAQPQYADREGRDVDLPNTNWLSAHGINLPTHTGMSPDDVHYVCDALVASLENR